jgi:hypothetical protein
MNIIKFYLLSGNEQVRPGQGLYHESRHLDHLQRVGVVVGSPPPHLLHLRHFQVCWVNPIFNPKAKLGINLSLYKDVSISAISGSSNWTQTLNPGMMKRVYCHCATSLTAHFKSNCLAEDTNVCREICWLLCFDYYFGQVAHQG